MAKERPTLTKETKEERSERKKAKSEKRSEKNGVHKSSSSKKEKKEKKEKKKSRKDDSSPDEEADHPMQLIANAGEAESNGDESQSPPTNGHVTAALLDTLAVRKPTPEPAPTAKSNGDDAAIAKSKPAPIPVGALVPFANPLADEKVTKKVLKVVKKAAKNKSLKRGVKEVVKSLRKSAPTSSSSTTSTTAPNIVILAADISPMDVISHIPVLCEDHNVPYLFVHSRAELGAASATKRPTSVVMVCRERGGKRKEGEKIEGEEEFGESFKDLAKVVERETRGVKV